MDDLFGFVAPIATSKINVKVDWSSPHFSQNFNIRIDFRAIITFACPLKPEGDRSGDYIGKRDESIVHG